ncbi:MAG TPA: hypothetical protein ENK38_01960 [Gammaproteobacteria bacterium]|nr:hypothetical protein [Gammaproteobacteria bacterium]
MSKEPAVIEHDETAMEEVKPGPIIHIPAQQQALSPLVQAVMDGKMQPDVLQQMLDIQTQYEKNEAEKAFHRALAEFKQHEIRLEKDKLVSFEMNNGGTKSYRHTTLGYALQIINPLLSQSGLSLTWETSQDMTSGGLITVTCVLSHAMGYSKSTSLSASPDASGNKNSIQAVGSTISYLQRYTAFALTGVASTDQDDDGAGSEPQSQDDPASSNETITDDQAKAVRASVKATGIKVQKFVEWLKTTIGVDSVAEIPAGRLPKVEAMIKEAAKNQQSA